MPTMTKISAATPQKNKYLIFSLQTKPKMRTNIKVKKDKEEVIKLVSSFILSLLSSFNRVTVRLKENKFTA